MGLFDGAGGLLGAAGISSAFGLYAQNQAEKNQGHYLQKQQDFNAAQAAINRSWSASEASKARSYARENYQNSVLWRVADMKRAGINPILAVGGGYGGSVGTAAQASSTPASSSLQSDNSVNSGLTAMQSYSSMFESMTRSIANVLKASKDKQSINIKTPISDIAESFTGGVEGIWDKWNKKGSQLGEKVSKTVSDVFTSASAKSYAGTNERLQTVYKQMQKLKGLPKSSYSPANYKKIANTILRDRKLRDGQKGILIKRLRTIWRTGK